MLDVMFTVDVEVWCDGWRNLDANFPGAFRRYVYGPTTQGDYGLPYKLKLFQDHGLRGVWFVEPLFSLRFGAEPLAEIVELIQAHDQEVQLHMHPEWLDELSNPPVANISGKKSRMADFSLADQTCMLAKGIELLNAAGATGINAFRAGNYGFNLDTLKALAALGIPFDSSYNAAMGGARSGLMPHHALVEPVQAEGLYEYPVTVFRDGTAHLRPTQLTACSWRELEGLLWRALEEGRKSFVIVSHNFELLDPGKTRPDRVVVDRYRRLCEFLSRNTDSFRAVGFSGLVPSTADPATPPLQSPVWKTGLRVAEQLLRRIS